MPILIYSLLRLGLFAASVGLLWWAGVGSWLAVVLAAFLAWGLSYVLLPGPRDRAAIEIAERVARRGEGHRFSARAEEDAAIEDAQYDDPVGSEREADPQQHSVREGEHPGHPEDLGEESATRAGHYGDAEHGDGS